MVSKVDSDTRRWGFIIGAILAVLMISYFIFHTHQHAVKQTAPVYYASEKTSLELIGKNAPGGVYAKQDISVRPLVVRLEEMSELNFLVVPTDDNQMQLVAVAVDRSLLSRLQYRLTVMRGNNTVLEEAYSSSLPSYKPQTMDNLTFNIELRHEAGQVKQIKLSPIRVMPKATGGDITVFYKTHLGYELAKIYGVQFFALVYLFILGFMAQTIFAQRPHEISVLLAILSFPFGVLIWIAFSVICLAIGVPFSTATAFSLLGVVLLAFLGKLKTLKSNKRSILKSLFWSSAIFMMIGIVLSSHDFSMFSFDSYSYIAAGKVLALEQYLTAETAHTLAAYSVVLPLIHSLAELFGGEYFYAFHSAMVLNFAVIIGTFIYKELCFRYVDMPSALFISVITVFGYFTTLFVLFNGLWVIPNFLAGVFLFLAFNGIIFTHHSREFYWLILSSLSLIAFSLTRVEGALFALIVMLFAYAARGMIYRKWLTYSLPYVCVISLWLLNLQKFSIGGSDFLTPGKIWFLVLTTAGLVILTGYLRYRYPKLRWRRNIPVYLTLALVTFIIVFTAIKFRLAKINLMVLIFNLFAPIGMWELFWMFMVPLLALCLFMFRKNAVDTKIGYNILVNLLLIYAIFFFRSLPLRIGFGDSANRMFMHITPLIVYYLALKFGGVLAGQAESRDGHAEETLVAMETNCCDELKK